MRQGYQYGFSLGRESSGPDCAVIENDEGWGIETGPDFGCIHHEEKK